jgi:translation initiation factor IF-2
MPDVKLKVFVAAARLKLSSDALISILEKLGFHHRGYTSFLTPEEFEAVQKKLKDEKTYFKSAQRKHPHPGAAQVPKPKLDEEKIARSMRETMARAGGRDVRRRPPSRRREETPAEAQAAAPAVAAIKVRPFMSVAELAHAFGLSASDVIKKCLDLGVMATMNQRLDLDTITLLADEFQKHVEVDKEDVTPPEHKGDEKVRPPVVVVMGHVDHGKTSLLDAIRKTHVAASEFGQITQHTGAYTVERNRKKITFLDTPGHEAFTAMRARGAQVTDIVVLVVAADDGVMPQTLEALNHARAAGVRIIVAITKTDVNNANVVRVKGQLMQQGVRIEEYGGSTICIETSVPRKAGIKELLEAILLTALELDLKAVYTGAAHGVVIEARMDKGRGNIATVLIQEGTLHRGDGFVCGEHYGKVRDMLSDSFASVPQAGPSMPVQVLGFSGLPEPGERFDVVANEREARETAERRAMEKRERIISATRPKLTLESLQQKIVEGQVRELRIVLKADTSGSAEALKDSLEGQSLDEVRVRVMHSGVGAVNVSDVSLAKASEAIIVGFHVEALADAKTLAEVEGIEIRTYRLIYAALDDVRSAMLGLLEPEKKEVKIGKAEIRQVFRIPKVGQVLGCYVTEGKLKRDAQVKVSRAGKEIFAGKISTLKRFKDDVREVETGYECGVGIDNAPELETGDILDAFITEETKRELPSA